MSKTVKVSTRYRIADFLVRLANEIIKPRFGSYLGPWPRYRPVDSTALGEKWACGAYSLEHLRSLVQQAKDDGHEPYTVDWLISDEGWQEIDSPEMAQEVADQLNKEATFIATKREQEELNRHEN